MNAFLDQRLNAFIFNGREFKTLSTIDKGTTLRTDTDINPTRSIPITVLKYGPDDNKSSMMDTADGSLMEMEPYERDGRL